MQNNFSLALGGGGARGLAHIGVIKRLEELEIKPISIAGTSMGAIVGTLYAIGKTSSDMEQIIASVNWIQLADIDLKNGVIKGKKIEAFFEKIFEGKTFADVSIPLKVVATDINTGEKIVFQSGKLSTAVRASISLPGVFIPKKIDNHTLVDGGLTENLPVEELPPGRVIAVSALRDITRVIPTNRKFFSWTIPTGIFANSYKIIQKTIDIMLTQNETRSIVSREDILYIRPRFDKLDYYEFHKYREFIEAGYKAAEAI